MEKELRNYYRLSSAQSQVRLVELLEAGELQPVHVQGWTQPAYCLGEPCIPRWVQQATALLSPFDSSVWEWAQVERLFDFRYRLEIYIPKEKRVYGYYGLPFLYNDQLVDRIERTRERLVVCALYTEAPGTAMWCLWPSNCAVWLFGSIWRRCIRK